MVTMRQAPSDFVSLVMTIYFEQKLKFGYSGFNDGRSDIEKWFNNMTGHQISNIRIENFNLVFDTNAPDEYILMKILTGSFD